MLSLALATVLAMMTSAVFADEGSDAATSKATEKAYREVPKAQFRALRDSAEPRDWAIASTAIEFDEDFDEADASTRAELLRSAAAAAPQDALVQWLALTRMPRTDVGRDSDGSVREPASALLRADGSNALAWIPTLTQASIARDDAAIDATLARMAAAPRLAPYGPQFRTAMLDAIRRHAHVDWSLPFPPRGMSLESQKFALVERANIHVDPSYRTVRAVCDATTRSAAGFRRFASCAEVGRRLAYEGTTFDARRDGFAILRASGQLDADDEIAADRLHWQLTQVEKLGEDLAAFEQFRVAWLQSQDDVEAQQAVLRANGIALDPPSGWVALENDKSRVVLEKFRAEHEVETDEDATNDRDDAVD